MSINRRMEKGYVVWVYTLQYYSAIKRNEIVLSGETRMDIETAYKVK